MNIEGITLGQLGTMLAFLLALSKGIDWIIEPFRKRNRLDQDVEERIKKIEEHQDNDNKRMKKMEDDTAQILLSVNTLLNHSIDNNHTDELKKRKAELDQYLIKRNAS